MGKIVCFGEVLLCIRARPNPSGKGPLVSLPAECQSDFGGAEFSTAIGAGMLGRAATLVSVIPAAVAQTNMLQIGTDAGVDMKHVMIDEQDDAEMGCELDARVRRSQQRKYSSFHLRVDSSNYDWKSILRGASVFCGDVLSLVVSEAARSAWIEAAYKARARKIPRALVMNYTAADVTRLADLWYVIKPLLRQVKISYFIVSEHTLSQLLKVEGVMSAGPEKDVAALCSITKALMVACTFRKPAPGATGQTHTYSVMAIASGDVISTAERPVQHTPKDDRTHVEAWLVGFFDSMMGYEDAAFRKMATSKQVRLLMAAGRRGDVVSALSQEHTRAHCRVTRSAVERVLSQVTNVVVVGKAAEIATRERLDAELQRCNIVPVFTEGLQRAGQAALADVAQALTSGGVRVVEVDVTAAGGAEDVVRRVVQAMPKDVIVGVSGVVSTAAVDAAVAAGAQYVITRNLQRDVVQSCMALGIPCFPGVTTATELGAAVQRLNAHEVVYYPAQLGGGPAAHKALRELMRVYPSVRWLLYAKGDDGAPSTRRGTQLLKYVPWDVPANSAPADIKAQLLQAVAAHAHAHSKL